MTEYQRHLFNDLLDVNYELSVGDYGPVVTEALRFKYSHLENELIDDMGYDEWKDFKEKGRQMFR